MMQPPSEDNVLYTLPHTNYEAMDQVVQADSKSAAYVTKHTHSTTTKSQATQRKKSKQDKKLLGVGVQFKDSDMVTNPPQDIECGHVVMD